MSLPLLLLAFRQPLPLPLPRRRMCRLVRWPYLFLISLLSAFPLQRADASSEFRPGTEWAWEIDPQARHAVSSSGMEVVDRSSIRVKDFVYDHERVGNAFGVFCAGDGPISIESCNKKANQMLVDGESSIRLKKVYDGKSVLVKFQLPAERVDSREWVALYDMRNKKKLLFVWRDEEAEKESNMKAGLPQGLVSQAGMMAADSSPLLYSVNEFFRIVDSSSSASDTGAASSSGSSSFWLLLSLGALVLNGVGYL